MIHILMFDLKKIYVVCYEIFIRVILILFELVFTYGCVFLKYYLCQMYTKFYPQKKLNLYKKIYIIFKVGNIFLKNK